MMTKSGDAAVSRFPTLREWREQVRSQEEFVIGRHAFDDLEIRPAPGIERFSYFYDTVRNRLVKRFVLGETDRTLTYCTVKLIHDGNRYQPRIAVSVDSKSEASLKRAEKRIDDGEDGHLVKSHVDLEPHHEEFWQLVAFMSTFPDLELPEARHAVVVGEAADAFKKLLVHQDHAQRLETLRTVTDHSLSERDVRLLVDRRQALDDFSRLLADDDYRAERVVADPGNGEEAMWQHFFEEHPWIFGYGLKLIACRAFDATRFEQTVTGADAFTGAGDRVDALMTTQGHVRSLLFVEIKRPDTGLLARRPLAGDLDEYRSGVFIPSRQLAGAINQVQVASHRAVRVLQDLTRARDEDGYLTEDIGTIQPRQVVIAGTLDELTRDGSVHPEHYRSFELYRRSIKDVEVIAFDELLARARFIAQD
jgi:hypothetical protein